MAQFNADGKTIEFDPLDRRREEKKKQDEYENDLSEFFDPATDTHSAFYMAMNLDKHAAHLVAGTSFMDLNSVILRTECNNVYESMNEEDMQRLRKLMWDVYIPHMQASLKNKIPNSDDTIDSFQAQMHVVHLSVRVAQALQLVFELNQKKSFSAVAKTAYEVALQDVLYHPHLKGKIVSSQYTTLINYLRRHPNYSTAYNTYVGYKLLRQQLVRGGGAGTNRKSNDAERLHDESANRLWCVLNQYRNIADDFSEAEFPFVMEWHQLYYKEVAETLYKKLSDYRADDSTGSLTQNHSSTRDADRQKFATQYKENILNATGQCADSSVSLKRQPVDIVNALQESRDTAAGGISKRSDPRREQINVSSNYTTATFSQKKPLEPTFKKARQDSGDNTPDTISTLSPADATDNTRDTTSTLSPADATGNVPGNNKSFETTNGGRVRRALGSIFN
jgi:hypothetical protein